MYTITLKGNSSNLSCDFFPPIEVGKNAKICLLGLQTNNSIPNIYEKCNRIGFISEKTTDVITNDIRYAVLSSTEHVPLSIIKDEADNIIYRQCTIPTGSYELNDLAAVIKQILSNKGVTFELLANNITLKCEMKSNVSIDLSMPNSIAPLLGFKNKIYDANVVHQSDTLINITKINCIYIESNLVAGSFVNGK